MERLTSRVTNLKTSAVNQMGHAYIQVDDIDEAMEKLSCYEDTGLEPEEIEEIKEKGEVASIKPVVNKYYYFCPACGSRRTIKQKHNYCHDCGQAFNWGN